MTYILRRGTPAAQNVAAQLSGPSLAHLGQDESGLSFLGLGVVPPEPSWDLMIRGARGTMEHNACVRVAEIPALRSAGSG